MHSQRTLRHGLVTALTLSLLMTGQTTFAATEAMDNNIDSRPGYGATVGDLIVARPIMAATTILGAATFLVALPFEALSGKLKESADTLVVKPAKATFARCLGCTTVQNDRKNENAFPDFETLPPARY